MDKGIAGFSSSSSSSSRPRYAVVSTVVVRSKRSAASCDAADDDGGATRPIEVQPGCALFSNSNGAEIANNLPPSWSARFVSTGNNLPLWHSLALLSDLVVLVFESKEDEVLSSDLVFALVSGFRQRTLSAGLPKGRLLILLNAELDEDVSTWKNRMAKPDSSFFTSDLLQQLFVANTASFFSALADILSDRTDHGVSGLVDATEFPHLLRQVYESEGGLMEEGDFLEDLRGGSLLPRAHDDEDASSPSPDDVHHMENSSTDDVQHENISPDVNHHEVSSSPPVAPRKTPVGGAQNPAVVEDSTKHADETSSIEPQEPPVMEQNSMEKDDDDDAMDVVDATQLTDMDHKALIAALEALDQVQTKQQDNWLDPGSLPIDFSGLVNPILSRFETALRACLSSSARRYMEQQVGMRLQQLHQQHLKDIRDYFGTLYEALLDQNLENPSSWQGYAERVSEAFRRAGQASVPLLAQQGGVFRDMDLGYVTAFSGLLEDMKTATELRHEHVSIYMDNNDEDNNHGNVAAPAPRRIAKWYEKLAARALVLLVNYFQGWLAWQGVRRAALERERNMPKFPLF